jgi:hypothetical protein
MIFGLLAGCNEYYSEWQNAPTCYTCTEAEMNRVQNEAKWCKENTTYKDTYCFGSAIMRICQKRNVNR